MKILTTSILILLSASVTACSEVDKKQIQELKSANNIPYYIQNYCEATKGPSPTEILKCYQSETQSYDWAKNIVKKENKSAWVENNEVDEWTDEAIYVAELGWIHKLSHWVSDMNNSLVHYQSSPPEVELKLRCESSGINIEVKMTKPKYPNSLRFRVDDNEFFDVALDRITDQNAYSGYNKFRISSEKTAYQILSEFRNAKKLKIGLVNYDLSSRIFIEAGQITSSEEITDTQEILVHGLSDEFIMNCAKYSN